MKKIGKVLTMLVLLAALGGAYYLSQRSQETRRGAASLAVNPLFLPNSNSVNQGDTFNVTFSVFSDINPLKGVDVTIKYDQDKLNLVSATPLYRNADDTGPNKPLFVREQNVKEKVILEGQGKVILKGTTSLTDPTKYTSQNVPLLKLAFRAKQASTGQATVGLAGSYANKIYGLGVSDTTTELTLASDYGTNANYMGTYTIVAGPTSTPAPTAIPLLTRIAQPTAVCTDNDMGKVYGTKGTTCVGTECKDDRCVGVLLYELYCDGGRVGIDLHSCATIGQCKDGACAPAEACTDSDSGKVYTVKGKACVGADCKEDRCLGALLFESFCKEGKVDAEIHQCGATNKCANGTCVAR